MTTGYQGDRWPGVAREMGVSSFELTPGRVTALYLVLGVAALVLFDGAVPRLVGEPLLGWIQSVKASVEVLGTAGLIYVLTARSRRQLQDQNDRLVRQRQELEVLHRVLRHDLRNALTVIHGSVDHAKSVSDVPPQVDRDCDRIETTADELERLVQHASRVHRITEYRGQQVSLSLAEAVDKALADSHTGDATVSVDIPTGTRVRVNPLFEEAITELVENAVEHGASNRPWADGPEDAGGEDAAEPTRISLTAEPGDDAVTLRIDDDGPGVPKTVKQVVAAGEFDQLLHLDGIGLWFAYWTVTDSGGSFDIAESDWGGASIRVTVPTAPPAPDVAVPV